MTNPKRYSLGVATYDHESTMDECVDGEWVNWDDYERLRAALERLQKACIESNDLVYAAIATEALSGSSDEPSPIHPVDAIKEIAEQAGHAIDPEREMEMRAICDQTVCGACGKPVQSEFDRVIMLEDRSEAARDRMLSAMTELTERMRTGYVESFYMDEKTHGQPGDFDTYDITVSIRREASGGEFTPQPYLVGSR